ncbi:uncharacterized protein V1516DRAFT_618818 [Lipomyces oligophaga]|uniref:uncharacterized protein n=1 Tax=Lipomyces oligophaga TaxID=45792 RepID=UPI0034CE47EF
MEEEDILNFLVKESSFPDIISRSQFDRLFTLAEQEDVAIKALYDDYRRTRQHAVRTVKRNIRLECAMSEKLVAQTIRKLRKPDRERLQDEADTEQIYNEILNNKKEMNLREMLNKMEEAIDLASFELERLDEQSKSKFNECDEITDSLSDLQYKKTEISITSCLDQLQVSKFCIAGVAADFRIVMIV